MPAKLEAIADFIMLKAAGGTLTEAEISAIRAAAPPPEGTRNGAVAVLPMFGVLRNRTNLLAEMSGGTSVEMLSKQFASLVADPNVSAIVLDIDSPGGSVAGIPEFAAQIAAARDVKPVVAVANTLAASAAYWLGSAASEFVATASAEVGSIGALMVHEDVSAQDAMLGVKTTIISAGKFKTEGNPYEALSDEAHASLQARVDEAYGQFTADVAKYRGVDASAVRGAQYGDGRVLSAKNALKSGMIDRIATLDETVARLLRPQGRGALGRRAEMGTAPTFTWTGFGQPDPAVDAIAARLDAIEARFTPPSDPEPEPEREPVATGLVLDIDAIATLIGERMKEGHA